LDDPNAENCQELQDFAKNNGYCGAFRTSAKTGLNISDSIEFLIRNIIERMENIPSDLPDIFNFNRKSVALDPEKHNEPASRGQRKEACC